MPSSVQPSVQPQLARLVRRRGAPPRITPPPMITTPALGGQVLAVLICGPKSRVVRVVLVRFIALVSGHLPGTSRVRRWGLNDSPFGESAGG